MTRNREDQIQVVTVVQMVEEIIGNNHLHRGKNLTCQTETLQVVTINQDLKACLPKECHPEDNHKTDHPAVTHQDKCQWEDNNKDHLVATTCLQEIWEIYLVMIL